MYAEHVPLLTLHGQTPSGFADIVTFAIATQSQRFYNVKLLLSRVHTDGLSACTMLRGRQKAGILHTHNAAEDLLPLPPCPFQALRTLLEIPAIGIVKAGFILQMLGYQVGCLDMHNLRIAGLSRRAFDGIPTSTEGLTHKLQTYLDTCHALGGAGYLWNQWCRVIAFTYPKHFASAYSVSAYHVDCIIRKVMA